MESEAFNPIVLVLCPSNILLFLLIFKYENQMELNIILFMKMIDWHTKNLNHKEFIELNGQPGGVRQIYTQFSSWEGYFGRECDSTLGRNKSKKMA